MVGDFVAFTRLLSVKMNEKLTGLSTGVLDDDGNKLSLVRKENQVDHVIIGLVTSSPTSTTLYVTGGLAKVGGSRIYYQSRSFDIQTGQDYYIDIFENGSMTLKSVTTGGTAPAVDTGGLRIYPQSGFRTDGVRNWPQGAIDRTKRRGGGFTVVEQNIGNTSVNSWNTFTVTFPNSLSMSDTNYTIDVTLMGEYAGGGQGGVRMYSYVAYATSPTTFFIYMISDCCAPLPVRIAYTVRRKDNY